MFKIWGSAMMAGSILCAVQSAAGYPALALDRHIELTNNTRMAIVEVYAAHTGTGRWPNDLWATRFCSPLIQCLSILMTGRAIAGLT